MASRLVEVPLGLALHFPSHQPLHVDFSALPCPALVRDLARALLDRTNTNGPIKSPTSVAAYVSAIRHVARWMDARGFDGNARGMAGDLVFDYWRDAGRLYESRLRTLLSHMEKRWPGSLAPEVAHQLNGFRLNRRRVPTPRHPFSAGETQRLLAACKRLVDAAETRSTAASDLVAKGAGPADVDWQDGAKLAALLDREGPVSATEVAKRLGLTKVVPGLFEALSDTQAMLFPGYDEVLAFRVLVGLQTGICTEGIGGLAVDCVEWTSDTQARVSWFKGRGGGRQSQVFTSRGRWSPGRLIERWLAVSERARRFAAEPDALWLFCHRARPAVHRPTFWSDGLDRFVARHGLLGDDGAPLRLRFSVLRPTYFARHDRDWNGALRIDANHSAAVEGDHYLAPTRASSAIDAVIEAAQRDAVRKAATAPLTLLSAEELDRLAASPSAAASRLAMSREAARELVDGERDVFAAACKDFHNSPHGPAGSPCPAPVWTCLSCPLAVFTPSHVPNLLRLRAHLDRQWRSLGSTEWMSAYGASHLRLERDILASFPPPLVHAAQAVVDGDLDPADGLYLPPEQHP